MSAPDDILVVSRQGRLADLWASNTPWRITIYLAASVAVGALSGLLWTWLTPLSSYRISDQLVASISERAQAQIVAADVVFTFVMGAVGIVIGIVGWMVWHERGWLVTTMPVIAAVAASLMAWRMGLVVSGSNFAERLAEATVGDVVSIDLQLRATSALLVAPFTAIIPIMLLAAFWPEARDGHATETPRQAD